MKVTKIKLNKYLIFDKELELDLTYPKGHPTKAGQPLDKVCFLGQSGSGKTSLLNLIKGLSTDDIDENCIDFSKLDETCVEIHYKYNTIKYSKKLSKDGKIEWDGGDRYENSDECKKTLENKFTKEIKNWLIYFPFDYINQKITEDIDDDFNKKSISHPVFQQAEGTIKESNDQNAFTNKRYWNFSEGKDKIKTLWQLVKQEIEIYNREYNSKHRECVQKQKDFLSDNPNSAKKDEQLKTFIEELAKWESENPNPIKQIASKYLDIILEPFQLKVKTDLDFENEGDKGFIKIQQKENAVVVPHKFLSTGTRQIMYTALPLYYLKPKNSLIIFDQPETSLYPNMQWILPEVYSKIASPDNQFFYATHSPIIASSFEPWEIIELKFDEKTGKIRQKPYYDIAKGRQYKNYKIFPKYLRWDSIFKIMFDLPNEGNDERLEKLMELATLDAKLSNPKLKKDKKQKLFNEYKNLVVKLDWDFKPHEENKQETKPV